MNITPNIQKFTQLFFGIILQQHEDEHQQLGLRDLRSAVCRAIREPRPQECANLPGAAINNMASLATIFVSATVFSIAKLF